MLPNRSRVGFRTSAYDGTNMLMVYSGTVAQEVTLPQTSAPIKWTFGVRWDRVSASFVAEVRTPAGELLNREDFSQQGREQPFDDPRLWRGAVDLSEFNGQTIRLALVFTTLNSESSVDDWRVEVFPEGMLFDVYLMEALTTRMVKLARTAAASWPVTNLWPNRGYGWRIDTIFDGVTNTGPLWTFTTRASSRSARLQLGVVPQFVCPGRPVVLDAYLRDTNGFALGHSTSSFSLVAGADDVTPQALITELNVSTNAEIEIANVSSNVLALGNWRVQVYFGGAQSSGGLLLPTNAFLAPGEMFTIRRADNGGAWPHLGIGGTFWGTNDPAGVVLRDNLSNVVDCVFVDRRPTNTVGWGSQRFFVTSIDWRGPVLENADENLTFQRVGNTESNRREDWVAATPNIGSPNSNLVTPFGKGFGRATAIVGGKTNIIRGVPVLTTTIRFPSAQSNVWLLASEAVTASSGEETFGTATAESEIFQVVDLGHCMSLVAAEAVAENAERASIKIDLGAPVDNDLPVRLQFSNTADIHGPDEVVVPAGKSEVSFEVALIDNNTLEGPRSFTIAATAPNYSDTATTIWIHDDEKPVLTVTAPEIVREGEVAQLVITSSISPVVPMRLSVHTEPLVNVTGSTELAPGTNKVVLYLGANDDILQGNGRMKVTIDNLDWPPATAEFDYIDATVGKISMGLPATIVEGGAQKVWVSLGAKVGAPMELKLTTSRPDLISVPEKTTLYPGVLETWIDVNGLPAAGPDRVEQVQLTATVEGVDSASGTLNVLIEEIDSGQIVSAEMNEDRSALIIHFTTRANWKYSFGSASNVAGTWTRGSSSVTGDGQMKEFSIDILRMPSGYPDYPHFFRVFREPPTL